MTYATARLQLLDRGAPVSPRTVEKELGHGSRDMLEEVYGRLGTVRHRPEFVEYRVEQHFTRQGETWIAKAEKTVQGNGAPLASDDQGGEEASFDSTAI